MSEDLDKATEREDLDKVIERMRGEIDDLQVRIAEKSAPWYKKTATLISVLALLFSFGTTVVSYERTKAQDIENKRQELRTVLQRLAALPKEYVDTARLYASDPASRTMVFGYIGQENALLSRHAADVLKSLPAGTASAAEYQAVALALQNAYDYQGANTFYEKAILVTDDFNTEIASVRGIACLRFIQGHPETGRVEFQKALDIFSKYPTYESYTKSATNATTEIAWAYSEAGCGAFDRAFQHLDSANGIVSTLAHSPGANELASQVAQARERVSTGNPQSMTPVGPALGPVLPPGAHP